MIENSGSSSIASSRILCIFDDFIDALSNAGSFLELAYQDRSVGVLDKVETVEVRDCVSAKRRTLFRVGQ